jgi:hypothetical protein
MRNKILLSFLTTLILLVFFTGCATILKGYEESVDLVNAPADLRVFTKDGAEISVDSLITNEWVWNQETREAKFVSGETFRSINLKTDRDYVLVLKYGDKEKIVETYRTLDAGWTILDFLFVFPWIIDAYTGCWYGFQPIIIDF